MLYITYEIGSLEKYGFDTKNKLKLIGYSEGDMIVFVKFFSSAILDCGFLLHILKVNWDIELKWEIIQCIWFGYTFLS